MMLYDVLSAYASRGVCPMHMPGHKRNTELLGRFLPYEIDITEIEGFDNLHDPHGILRETAESASALYGSRKAFLLVNGSTGGILSAIRAAVKCGDQVLLARNCHQSVYNAAELNRLKTAYLIPETDTRTGIEGSITPEQVENGLRENPDTRLVVLTSPTYAGVVSDIRSISDLVHQRGIPLMVDEAHGAHLGFSDFFPEEAVKSGADLVITSLHKTLPTLTQCALALVGGELIDEENMARQLAVFETSSPSYLLMSSIDSCLRLLSEKRAGLFGQYEKQLCIFDDSVKNLKKLKVLCHGADQLSQHAGFFRFDPGKLVVSTRGTTLTGKSLAHLLRTDYRIELEMAGADYAVAMTSICDTAENFKRLADALLAIDSAAEESHSVPKEITRLPAQIQTICEAVGSEGEFMPLEASAGAMSLEYVWAYPPGIPLIVPGERFDPVTIGQMRHMLASGIALSSTKGKMPSVYARRV